MTKITDRLTERRWETKNEVELKSCPFCGNEGVRTETKMDKVRVFCNMCNVGTPFVTLLSIAVGVWNKRV